MSKQTEKVLKEIQKFMDSREFDSEEEANIALQAFIEDYNANMYNDYDGEPETAADYFELACEVDNEKDAIKYAKKALELDKYCIDADMLIASIQCKDDFEKFKKKVEKILQKAEKHLKEEGYFDEDCMDDFWEMPETISYMGAKYEYIKLLVAAGKFKKAKEMCEEMLRLNESDNLGVRYTLMGIYAYFEDELSALRLYKKFSECSPHMLLPLITLYYKADSYKTAEKYLRLAMNEGFEEFFLTIEKDEEFDDDEFDFDSDDFDDFDDYDDYDDFDEEGMPFGGMYKKNSKEEVNDAFIECVFLYMSAPGVMEWIKEKVIKGF